jgi:CheY-like chemotaxis protein
MLLSLLTGERTALNTMEWPTPNDSFLFLQTKASPWQDQHSRLMGIIKCIQTTNILADESWIARHRNIRTAPRRLGKTQPVRRTHSPKGECVLVVEDEDAVRKLAHRMLVSLGYTVLEAESAAKAMELATQHNGQINFLLTDVIMPKKTGVQLAGSLSHLHAEMKIIFMSGYTDDIIKRHGTGPKNAQFLTKPFTRQELAEALYRATKEST